VAGRGPKQSMTQRVRRSASGRQPAWASGSAA
jgi:hypothetical protein